MDIPVLIDNYNKNEFKEGITFQVKNNERFVVVYTYRCPIACAHCITKSGPQRSEKLSVSETEELLGTGRQFGKHFVTFTGGEPLIFWEEVVHLIKVAKTLGYVTALDTNCYWADSDNNTQTRLATLARAGLDAIFPSADSFHQQFLPVSRPFGVLKAAHEIGMICEINFYPSADQELDKMVFEAMGLAEEGYFCDGMSTYGRNVGRHLKRYEPRTIDSFTDNSSFTLTVTPDGEVVFNTDVTPGSLPFRGTTLIIGNIRDELPESIFKLASEDPLLLVLGQFTPLEFVRTLAQDLVLGNLLESLMSQTHYTYTEAVCDLLRHPGVPAQIRTILRKQT